MIMSARTICQVIDGLDEIINNEMELWDTKMINTLTTKERKGKLILAILKEKIEDGNNITLNDEHTGFKKNFEL